MGPVGWLLFLVFVLPFLAAWYALCLLVWLCILICRAIAGYRAARQAPVR
jgi:hypothetical protein